MRTADRLYARFGKADRANFAFIDQVLHRADYILDGNVWIDAMLIKEINCFNTEALQRSFGHGTDIFGAAVHTNRFAVFNLEAEFRGNGYFIAESLERLAQELFIFIGAINFSRIEECDAQIKSTVQCTNGILFFLSAIGIAHAHAAKADCGHSQFLAKLARFHRYSFRDEF